jgi:hypothetical protein
VQYKNGQSNDIFVGGVLLSAVIHFYIIVLFIFLGKGCG